MQKVVNLKSYDAQADRDLIATVLLDAVEQSFKPHEHKARRWLKTIYAESLLILLDISPSSALHHLAKKWQKIDADAPTPGQWLH
ncbi:hypothetical protein A6M27_10710 [Acidithiobacillus thiooxidans]|uniref:Uncharacterized protein n=1 Tax=Acidithiobacillus thiooxidans TaxID=930 RepID=A0A1C2I765_ACITH|nr:hypothetical protein A6O24_18915 [Acidithiobacillus thiooxidans]OCX71839.1 hypothetical protein A6P07_11255 [Acidithiobacillus thiooxidans]OCX76818.1 hypothetical protein A6O26_20685 [Acidithiobacillus thiooxidans]OCX87162.1 hypothetical protein A6M27_10710 [Acidithiobacillus thiooxidans]OFC49686.1 hypothetical protein BAE47_04710 [Acidithiobacillus thiooxidans]